MPRSLLTLAPLLSAGFLALSPPAAQAAGPVTTTSLFFPIGGTVLFPPSPCMPNGQGEFVALNGSVHVLTQIPQPEPDQPQPEPDLVSVHLNLVGVEGTGMTTGLTYHAVGASRVSTPQPEPDTPQPLPGMPFDLVQDGACQTLLGGAHVQGFLTFDANGHLLQEGSGLVFVGPGN